MCVQEGNAGVVVAGYGHQLGECWGVPGIVSRTVPLVGALRTYAEVKSFLSIIDLASSQY